MIPGFKYQGKTVPFPDVIGCLGRPLSGHETEALHQAGARYRHGSWSALCSYLPECEELKWAIATAIKGYDLVTDWAGFQPISGVELVRTGLCRLRQSYRQAWVKNILNESSSLEARMSNNDQTYPAKGYASGVLRTAHLECLDLSQPESAAPLASLVLDGRKTYGARAASVAAFVIGALIERGHLDTAQAVAQELAKLAE